MRIKVASSDKATGHCSMMAGKSRGRTPFCRTLKTVFSRSRIFCKAFSLQLFHWNSCKMLVSCSGLTRRCGLVRPASKSCRFSHHPLHVPEAWHGDFAACGQRSGLLALNLANIFEKLLDQKTFICLWLIVYNHLKNNLLRKCGLLAHTSAAFLKNCCTKKLLFACGSVIAADMGK